MTELIKKTDIRVVTVCDQPPVQDYYCYHEFHRSLERQGVYALELGKKEGEYLGLASKPKLLLKAIKEGWIKEKYIIFCDCYDLVFQAPVEYIIERYLNFESDIVISAEKNCFPATYKNDFNAFWGEIPPTLYQYINSGFIVGTTEAFRVMLERMDLDNEPDDHIQPNGEWFHSNDQELFQRAWVNQLVKIGIDNTCHLSWCMVDVLPHEVGFLNPIQNMGTGTYPCTIHWNGYAKTQGTMDKILKVLNLR